jgi:hypothetical protein
VTVDAVPYHAIVRGIRGRKKQPRHKT